MIKSTDTYNIFADIYDSYVGKYNFDFEFYKSYCSKSDKIIEIGCGTGRILNYLLQQDYSITGVDTSLEMLEKAGLKLKRWIDSGKLNLLKHDFCKNILPDKFYRALVTFYTFNYIINKPVEFLRNIFNSLEENGFLLMDAFYPNPLCDRSIDNKWIKKEISADNIRFTIKDNRAMTGNIERRQQIFYSEDNEIKIDTDRRYYPPAELKKYLKEAGFTKIEFSIGYNLSGFCEMIDERKLKNNYIVIANK
jgi:SAM-dependent methyltransferase